MEVQLEHHLERTCTAWVETPGEARKVCAKTLSDDLAVAARQYVYIQHICRHALLQYLVLLVCLRDPNQHTPMTSGTYSTPA